MSQRIFLTGANRGIGLKFCEVLLKRGDTVHATTRNIEKSLDLKKLKSEFSESLFLYEFDCKNLESIRGLKNKISTIPSIDLFINNAGMFAEGDRAPLVEQKAEDVLDTFFVNALAPFEITKTLLPVIEKSKKPKVAYITSRMGSIEDNTGGGYYAYRMSKAALNMFQKSFSVDFPHIQSVVLHPGWVKTDMGGSNAQITTDESVSGMLKVIDNLNEDQSGGFINYNGQKLPW